MIRIIRDALRPNAPTKPSRALDTPFIPNQERPSRCAYTVHLNTGSVIPGTNAEAKVELFTGSSSPPTTRRCLASVKVTRSSLTTGTYASENDIVLAADVPRGHWVELVSTVTGSASAVLAEVDEVEQ